MHDFGNSKANVHYQIILENYTGFMFSLSQKLHIYQTFNFFTSLFKAKKSKENTIVYIICNYSKNVKIIKKRKKEMEVGAIAITNTYWAFLPLHAQLIKAYF